MQVLFATQKLTRIKNNCLTVIKEWSGLHPKTETKSEYTKRIGGTHAHWKHIVILVSILYTVIPHCIEDLALWHIPDIDDKMCRCPIQWGNCFLFTFVLVLQPNTAILSVSPIFHVGGALRRNVLYFHLYALLRSIQQLNWRKNARLTKSFLL